jgi:hypothetical protein
MWRRVITIINPDDDPVNRETSGMRQAVLETGKDLFRLLAGHLKIEGVRTKIDFVWPFDGALLVHGNGLEHAWNVPGRENALAGKRRDVDDSALAVIELQIESEIWKRFRVSDSHIPMIPPGTATFYPFG